MMTPLVLRLLLLALLMALIVVGTGGEADPSGALRLANAGVESAAVADGLLAADPPTAVFREAGSEPTEHELEALSALADRAPLVVALPESAGGVTLTAPQVPLTGRYGAVEFTAFGAPGDTVAARLLDPRGDALDSLRVVADSTGLVRGAFRVRPEREGWTEWRVGTGGTPGDGTGDGRPVDVARVGAWVRAADPPRVLVLAGPPTWESRYVVRALEGAGADVALIQRLGRENVVTSGDVPPVWWRPSALARRDVVVLLPGAAPGRAALEALRAWVADGHGLLDASGGGQPSARPADELVWSAPAAIAPLPSSDLESTTAAVPPPPPGGVIAVRGTAGEPLLTLAPWGAGRVARLGVMETWRWAMEGGLTEEHRAFWRSQVDWLAVPSADSLALRIAPAEGAPGVVVDVRSSARSLTLRRPAGSRDEALVGAEAGAERHARFIPVEAGPHEVVVDGSTVGAFMARPREEAGPAALGWARLSLLAAASGGGALGPEAFGARLAAAPVGAADRPPWPLLAFLALVLIAISEWVLRRLRGLR